MFLIQLFIGILAYYLFEAQKYLRPRSFNYKTFWSSNKWYMLWCSIVAVVFFAAYFFAPDSIAQILATFGYNFNGEFSGVTCGIAIAVLSKRIAKSTKKTQNGKA